MRGTVPHVTLDALAAGRRALVAALVLAAPSLAALWPGAARAAEGAPASSGAEYRLLSSIPGQASEVGERSEEGEAVEPAHEAPAGFAGTTRAGVEAAGHAQFRLDAAKSFDRFAHRGSWIQGHVDVIKAYPPFGDVYVQYGKPVLGYHDPATEGFAPLDQAHIEAFVAKVKRDMSVGYAGVFVDDANWSFSPSPGPEANLANLLEAIRHAEPSALIEMNSQYRDIWPKMKAGDANVARALAQVNIVTKEFGVGPTAGINSGQDYGEFMTYADTLRGKGIHIVMTGEDNNYVPTLEYNLATCLLINDGKDFVNKGKVRLRRFWHGFEVNLGSALGPRERSSSGVWSRRFAGGVVYTVEPGAATQTIKLGKTMHSWEWGWVEAVTLAPE
ncbi:MAG TPA: hypothetical protein VNZ05_10170, partial [Solirubrobacteraceae bacterium]|nr:hypothetical protein [Solirubrobacteraceae bacterium]